MGLGGSLVLDEILILLPYLVAEMLGWLALFPAIKASRMPATPDTPLAYMIVKCRQTFGMVLPLVILFWVGDRLTQRLSRSGKHPRGAGGRYDRRWYPGGPERPAFVRLAWPSHPMAPGPLRSRLERLARRFGFRYSQIRVLDTGGATCNAFIVGALPWFRHVLLSDGLVEQLNDEEVEAVFGHEMGHVYHQHMAFIGLFALGSVGVLALLGQLIDSAFSVTGLSRMGQGMVVELAKAALILACVVVYLRLVFGPLSRRFECEADLFACRAVSCGRSECPPHQDSADRVVGVPVGVFCPVGIRICMNAPRDRCRTERPGARRLGLAARHDRESPRLPPGPPRSPGGGTPVAARRRPLPRGLDAGTGRGRGAAFLVGAFDGALRA